MHEDEISHFGKKGKIVPSIDYYTADEEICT